RHDGRSGLVLREGQFDEAGARTGAEQADVLRDLEQRSGDRVQRAAREDIAVMGGELFELVRRGIEGKAGDLRDLLREQFGEAFLCVESGADGGAALGERIQLLQRNFQALQSKLELARIAGKLLAQRQGRGVLKVGAADLHDV